MDIVTRKKLNILIQLALADKDFSDSERDLIVKVARDKGFPLETLQEMMQNPEPIGTLGALSETQKEDYLVSSIELVLADNRVVDSEIKMSQDIAIRLGFFKNVVSHLIQNLGKRPVHELGLNQYRY